MEEEKDMLIEQASIINPRYFIGIEVFLSFCKECSYSMTHLNILRWNLVPALARQKADAHPCVEEVKYSHR